MKRGFTLIELLVVISIIGLLSSIVLASVIEVRTKAGVARLQQDGRSLITAMELYHSKNNGYPPPALGSPPYYSTPIELEPHLASEISSFVPNINQIPGLTVWKRDGDVNKMYTYVYLAANLNYKRYCEGSSPRKEPYILHFGISTSQKSKIDGKFPKVLNEDGTHWNITQDQNYSFYCLAPSVR